MISSLNFLKTEVEMKQGKAGEASSLMITHQVYKMCADCLIAKVLNCEALWWWLGEDGNQLWKYWVAPQAMVDSISNLIIAWPVMMKDWNLTGLWSEWSLHLIISRAVWDTNCGNVASFILVLKYVADSATKVCPRHQVYQGESNKIMCSHIEDGDGFVESAGTINLFPTPLWVAFHPHYTQIPLQYTGCPWYQLCWQLQLKYYMCITQHKMFSKYLPVMSSR